MATRRGRPLNKWRDERDAYIVALRIGPPPRTLERIASQFDCTREYIRQILKRAGESNGIGQALADAADACRDERARRAAAEKAQRRDSTMSINVRLAEHGLRWCAAGKRVMPLSAFRRHNGKWLISRCLPCGVVAAAKRRESRLSRGVRSCCGAGAISPLCVSFCGARRIRINANAIVAAAKRRAKKGTTLNRSTRLAQDALDRQGFLVMAWIDGTEPVPAIGDIRDGAWNGQDGDWIPGPLAIIGYASMGDWLQQARVAGFADPQEPPNVLAYFKMVAE